MASNEFFFVLETGANGHIARAALGLIHAPWHKKGRCPFHEKRTTALSFSRTRH